jgi:hypothetical protein
MAMEYDDIKPHEKYLAKVPREVLRKRLAVFRLKEEVMDVLPFICRKITVKAPFTEYRQWLHPLDPISLDDLKNWFGVPNETAGYLLSKTPTVSSKSRLSFNFSESLPRALPMMHHYEFESLDQEQRLAVQQTANSLLYGYVDPKQASQPAVSGVVNYMISAARKLKVAVFVTPDLIVCPDDVVEFENVPLLFFNNILVYGNGQIVTKSKTKIHSFQIRHVDA